MLREIGWDAITRDDRSVLTVGTFDGVHRGHQAILRFLRARAAERDGLATVVSFDPHPRTVVHDADVPLLTTVAERGDLLAAHGVDRFVVLPFTANFARLGPVAYVEDILVRRIGLQAIAVGYDHRFGRRREGDRALLERLGRAHDFAVDVIPAQEDEAEVISSSAVRDALDGGDVRRAARLLGRPYRLAGTVGRGEQRGRTLGFPTANLELPDARKLVPQRGVYAVRVHLPAAHGGGTAPGMLNIGRRPTFGGMDVTVEVHLIDFDGDLYDARLEVAFVQRLRDEQRFDGPDALAAQLSADRAHCTRVLEATPESPA
jgi:riboflavin kinase/FMN adenylyltransferase